MYAPVVPSKTIPNSRLKWAKCFQTKKVQNPYLPLYKGVPPLILTPFMIVRDRDKVGEENSILIQLMIQRTGQQSSTKNL